MREADEENAENDDYSLGGTPVAAGQQTRRMMVVYVFFLVGPFNLRTSWDSTTPFYHYEQFLVGKILTPSRVSSYSSFTIWQHALKQPAMHMDMSLCRVPCCHVLPCLATKQNKRRKDKP